MYLLSAKIYSKGQEFNSHCYSNTITVYTPATNFTSASNTPNYKFTFSASNFSAIGGDEQNQIKASIFNYMTDLNMSVSNLQLTASASRRRRDTGIVSSSGSIIIVFYSSSLGQTLANALANLNISNYVVLSSATVNGVTIYSTESSSSSSSSSSSLSVKKFCFDIFLSSFHFFIKK